MKDYRFRLFNLVSVCALMLFACTLTGQSADDIATQVAATLTAVGPAGGGDTGDTGGEAPPPEAATATFTLIPTDTLVPTDTITPTPDKVTVTVSVDTNCRTGPGSDKYKASGQLLVGQVGEVVGMGPNGAYALIKNPIGVEPCWLWLQYATLSGNYNALPIAVVPTPVPVMVSGIVWNDHCSQADPGSPPPGCVNPPSPGPWPANGKLDAGETGFAGVLVNLGAGACPSTGLDSTHTNASGNYSFGGLTPGTYCVSIKALDPTNVPILIPGGWSYPNAKAEFTITLMPETNGIANFGWDFQLD